MEKLLQSVRVHLVATCRDCQRRHEIQTGPDEWLIRMRDWEVKHRGHRIEFRSPHRILAATLKDRLLYPLLDRFGLPWWLTWAPNTDFLMGYASSAAFTITLASLASDATFLAGRESDAIDNTGSKYLDYLVGGKITTGTSPSATKTIRVYAYGSVNDTPLYPDVLDGTDSNESITSADILNQLPMLAALATNNTSDRAYWVSAKSLSLVFGGGAIPKFFGLFVAHDTGQNLNATGSNHALYRTGAYIVG